MNTRRFVLHLIVGLLTFLIGVAVAVALGGFDPLARLTRENYRHQYAIPMQSLSVPDEHYHYHGCRGTGARTAEWRYQLEPNSPPAPAVPVLPDEPYFEDDAPPPPPSPRAPRANR